MFVYTFCFSRYLIKDYLLTVVTTDVYWYLESFYNLHYMLLDARRFQGGDQASVLLHDLNGFRLRLFLVSFCSGKAGGYGGVRVVTDDI